MGYAINHHIIQILALYQEGGLEEKETWSQHSLWVTMISKLEEELAKLYFKLIGVVEDHLLPWDRVTEQQVFYHSM